LRTAGQDGVEAEFRVVPLDAMTEFPLLASFGNGYPGSARSNDHLDYERLNWRDFTLE